MPPIEDRQIVDVDDERDVHIVDLGGDDEEDDDEVTRIDARHEVDDPEAGQTGDDAKPDEPEKEDDPEEPLPDSAERDKKATESETQLDPELEALFAANPKAKEAWDAQVQGLETARETLLNERKEFESSRDSLLSWGDALGNPESWQAAYKDLGEQLANHYGVDARSLAGSMLAAKPTQEYPFAPGVTQMQEGDELYQRLGYESPTEMHQAKEIQELRAMQQETLKTLQGLKNGQVQPAESKRQAELGDKVTREISGVKKHFEREHKGFNVTENMLRNALDEFPDKAPAVAVELAYAKSILRFREKQLVKRTERGPELIPTGHAKGTREKSAEEFTFRDALRG